MTWDTVISEVDGGILKHQISAFSHTGRCKTLKNHIFLLIMLVLPVTTYMIIIKNIFLVSSEYTVDLRHIKFLYNLVKSIFWDRLSLNFILDIYLLLPHS